MTRRKKHVEIYALHCGMGAEAEAVLASVPVDMDRLRQCYLLCEYMPMAELESEDCSDIARWCMETSRGENWRRRQMRTLSHMDMLDMGGDVYLVYDAAMARSGKREYSTIQGIVNYVLVKVKVKK